ncbi:CBS domain-containing protein [Geodermatophilus sp. SYSU D01176]
MQARDVMTREVVTVGPETPAKYAAEVMAEHGFAALPVVDDDGQLVGIVAEADVLRDRMPPDPRLHLRRDDGAEDRAVSLLVCGVMTSDVRCVEPVADVADVARVFVDERLRSVPVVDGGRLVGIVSRRDLLRALVRPDEEIRHELLRLVEGYTGALDAWEVTVTEGLATIRRIRGRPEPTAEVEQRALSALARTVRGVVGVRVLPAVDVPARDTTRAAATNA